MMNVPLRVISGKSPMKTVCCLISPVVLFMNSALTYSGAAKVASRSLHSSSVIFASANSGSEKDRDMVPWKSSIGEISSKMSVRPEVTGTEWSSAAWASSTRATQRSLPIRRSNDSVCSASRSGTSSGSEILAKEMRPAEAPDRGETVAVSLEVLEATT